MFTKRWRDRGYHRLPAARCWLRSFRYQPWTAADYPVVVERYFDGSLAPRWRARVICWGDSGVTRETPEAARAALLDTIEALALGCQRAGAPMPRPGAHAVVLLSCSVTACTRQAERNRIE